MSIVASGEDSARQRLRKALQRAPLFADLEAHSMSAVERELSLLVLPGGAPLFRQGEPADAVYVVASGCLGVFRHEDESSADEPLLMAEIPPGNIVGEMSLLSHGQRTRSVAALRDSEVWRLARGSFDKLTARHPEVLPTLMRSVAVRNAMGPTKRRRQPRTFAILPTGVSTPAARFAVMLAAALGRIGSQVEMLGPESMDRDPEWFARAETEASFVLYRADPTATEWTELCLRQADCLVVVRAADDELPTRLPFEIETAQSGAVFHRRRELVLLHEGHDPKPGSTAPMLAGGLYGQHHHVRLDVHADVDRLARLLTGHAVGVVMAGGGARAFTHIGVIKALRASGVPIDQVGGTSMGAIVAASVASRWPDEEITRHFRAAFVDNNPLSDYTLPLISLYAGRRVTRLLRLSFGEKEIEDGGVIDNFPVRAMRRTGRGTTIGVDIDTGGALAAGAGVMEPWSAWQFFRRLIWKRNETLPIPSIVAILLRSALVASAARAAEDRQAADLLIVPPMTHIDLLDWTSFDAAIEVGYRTTMEALDKAKATPAGARLFLA